MRKKKPHIVPLSEVNLSRKGQEAIIEYKDTSVSTVHFKIGENIETMTDEEILELFNDSLRIRNMIAEEYTHVAVEIPPGRPQIEYFEAGDQWVPKGQVLRCTISDGGPDCEATIYIDDQELSLAEFGRLLTSYAGWGMRIAFVPEDEIEQRVAIDVRDVKDDSR